MKKTYTLLGIAIVTVSILALWKVFALNKSVDNFVTQKINASPTPTPIRNVDYEASFLIYINGTKRIFTNAMYHNLSKDVYIESTDPSIVHVKKPKVKWMDFFTTLPMKLTGNCLTTGTKETFCLTLKATLKLYLNGVKNTGVLNEEIKDGDQLLISYGPENETQIKSQLNSFSNISN